MSLMSIHLSLSHPLSLPPTSAHPGIKQRNVSPIYANMNFAVWCDFLVFFLIWVWRFCVLFVCFDLSLGKTPAQTRLFPLGLDLMWSTAQFHFIVSHLGNDQSFNGPVRANLGIISYVPFINRVHFDVLFIAQVNSI